MPTPEELMLQDLRDRYATVEVGPAFTRLYGQGDANGHMFAHFHERLNGNFDFMNYKAGTNGHFNADDSRQLMSLIDEIREAQEISSLVGTEFTVADGYRKALERCGEFLVPSGGSAIPDDLGRIEIIKYKPVFIVPDTRISILDRRTSYDMHMIGSGSYANVFRYIDPIYDIPIALKRAKRDLNPSEVGRFRNEFELLKRLRFPYVLQVFTYNDERNEYTMEYCDSTLNDFVDRNNARMSFATRKRVGLQFLYGMNYLHSKRLLHRDVSFKNVLVKQYDGVAVVVKLSDFGLYKDPESSVTRTESELRGTILDPTITSFKEYNVANEIYAIGVVLSFIFSGRRHIGACTGEVGAIIDRCVANDVAARYTDVRSIIDDVESLQEPPTTGTPPEAPA